MIPSLIYADRDPLEFVLENIMFPIIRHWVECFLNFGFLLEPHGQNVLFEIGKDRKTGKVPEWRP
jgi:siderophore synthetase component